MTSTRNQRWAFVAVLLLATALHGHENWPREGALWVWGWFLWSLLPYAVFSLVVRARGNALLGVAAVSTALAVDVWTHYTVFVAPSGSTAALALIFMPLWSTLVFGPLAMLVVWLISKRQREPLGTP